MATNLVAGHPQALGEAADCVVVLDEENLARPSQQRVCVGVLKPTHMVSFNNLKNTHPTSRNDNDDAM
jgi:hypothetical protein